MKVAIVIPCINLWNEYTKACLDSIKTKYDHRILLIDNGSTDVTKVEAGKLVSATFSHKRNEERWSCSKSWNYGVKDAFERGYDLVLILNNDVVLHPEAIDRLVEKFASQKKGHPGHPFSQPELGMVTMMDITGECVEPKDIFNKSPKDFELVAEAEHPCFSGFMINQECYERIGEFDEGFDPCYFEDNDYHRRIKLGGMKAIVLPTALFYHYGSRTQNESGDTPVCSSPQFEKLRAYYVAKWGGPPGHETWDSPFNGTTDIKLTKQNNK